MKFVKIKMKESDLMPYWWEYDESTPVNNAVLKNFYMGKNSGNDLTGYEIVEAKSWFDLDWKGTTVYSDIYYTGWLSPNGKFFGCDYECHEEQAMFVHKTNLTDLEEKGFIKITKKLRTNEYIVLNDCNVTLQQYNWFKKNYVLPNRDEVIENLKWYFKMNLSEDKEDLTL